MDIRTWWANQKQTWQRNRERTKKHKALARAIRKGDLDGVKTLLAEGAEPGLYGRNNYERSPMDVCAVRGTAEMMKLLVAHGGRPDGDIIDTADSMGGGPGGGRMSVFYRAVQAGNDDVASYLAKLPGVDTERSGHYFIGGRVKHDYPAPIDTADKEKMPQTYAILARRKAARLLEEADQIQRGPRMPRKNRDLGPW